MPLQLIDLTTNNGSYIGDPARTAFNKLNDMLTEIYGPLFLRKTNLLGAVSMLNGVPNGGVIERISNANGKAVRFADGTQICRVTKSATWNANGTGGAYWLFPAAFYEQPGVIAMISTASPQTYNASAEAINTNGCNLWAGGSLGATGTIQAWAFGNWAA